ncbi:MAG TPA: DUF2169 domain-containing protein [Stellaceae bacterium]
MELINATRMVAGYSMGIEPSGRELLVVAIKGTFRIPRPGETMRLADAQLPLVMADTFTGTPGSSAPLHEIDFAPRKSRCDIVLLGSAYAPQGRPVLRVQVGVKLGAWQKLFTVVGDRVWRAGPVIRAGAPEPFAVKPISYDNAFGGVDAFHPDPGRHSAYLLNPVGRGYHRLLDPHLVDNTPLPNTEESDEPVTTPNGNYRPMAFGPVGRNFSSRSKLAGTYDQHWLDEAFPFLPADFDEGYYQAAPADQQLPIPVGQQEVVLLNLTPDGVRSFTLPNFEAPVHVFPRRGGREDFKANLDTIVVEPDAERLSLTWRITRPLKRDLFEISQVLVGTKDQEWWQDHGVTTPALAPVPAPSGASA